VEVTASATRLECSQLSELVNTTVWSKWRPAANVAAIFRNDVNDCEAHAVGNNAFTLTMIRLS
jgi:hypothetical protein